MARTDALTRLRPLRFARLAPTDPRTIWARRSVSGAWTGSSQASWAAGCGTRPLTSRSWWWRPPPRPPPTRTAPLPHRRLPRRRASCRWRTTTAWSTSSSRRPSTTPRWMPSASSRWTSACCWHGRTRPGSAFSAGHGGTTRLMERFMSTGHARGGRRSFHVLENAARDEQAIEQAEALVRVRCASVRATALAGAVR